MHENNKEKKDGVLTVKTPLLKGNTDEYATLTLTRAKILALMTLVYFGVGLLWFSIHEKMGLIDSLWIIVQIFTTVGYDYPEREDHIEQVFLIFFIIFGVSIVFTWLTAALDSLLTALRTKHTMRFRHANSRMDTYSITSDSNSYVGRLFKNTSSKDYIIVLLWLLLVFGGAFCIAVLEQWKFVSGLYFIIVSGSTVGFGDWVPETQSGKMFMILLLPSLIASTGYVFSIFFTTSVQAFIDETSRELLKFDRSMDKLVESLERNSSLAVMDFNNNGQVSESEFMFQILYNAYNVPDSFIDAMKAKYRELDYNGDGFMDLKSDPEV